MKQVKWRSALDLLVTALMLVLIVGMGWRLFGTQPPEPIPPTAKMQIPDAPVSLEGAHLRGSPSAPVAVVVYTDYECPACRMFENETLPTIVREYVDTGQVLLAFRPFPLGRRGAEGIHEAGLAQCAGDQGQFWKAHDALFVNAGASMEAKNAAVGIAIAADPIALAKCASDARADVVNRSEQDRKLGVVATPTFLIGEIDKARSVVVRVVHQGVSQGSDWFKELLQPVVVGAAR